MKASFVKSTLLLSSFIWGSYSSAIAGDLSSATLDQYVTSAMKEFQVPGVAIGIIKDGEIQHLKGYGVRDINKDTPIDGDTMYAIASNSKAFTASAIAVLVDDGVLHWDDKVIDFLPDFRMMDPYVTREFTIRDLLTHRSGMGIGAGDLMFWPSTWVTREEIIKNVRHLKMVSGFRSQYAYDNTLYVIAGEVIAAASGMSYESFVQSRIMNQLAIGDSCRADITTLSLDDNIAEPHIILDGEIVVADRLQEMGEPMVIAAAGGIQCSARALLKWVDVHLNDGAGVISKKQHDEMWSAQTIQAVSKSDKNWHDTNFAAYGLGFRLKDYHGVKHVSHTGGLLGMVTYIAMLPSENLGVVVLTNQETGSSMRAIMENILHSYVGIDEGDFTLKYADLRAQSRARAEKQMAAEQSGANAAALLPLESYVGTYRDPWFGDVNISIKNGGLYFKALRSEKLRGPLSAFNYNTFKVIWDNRSFKADAYAMFSMNFEGKVDGLKMKPISPLTDFSYDFQDLNFIKAE